MSNEYYTSAGVPATGATLSSATMRAEYASIETGFNKLPTMTGNSLKLVRVAVGESALETVDPSTLSLTSWTESVNSASPNDTIPAARFIVTNAATNVDAVIAAKGTGAILAQVPDGATAGGNKRGTYAVDWQHQRAAAAQVASGSQSTIAGGYANTASGASSAIGGGTTNTLSGVLSSCPGGNKADDRGGRGAQVWGGNGGVGIGTGGGPSVMQTRQMLYQCETADATPKIISTNGSSSGSVDGGFPFPAVSGVFYLRVRVIARLGTGTIVGKSWTSNILVKKTTTGDPAIIGSPSFTSDFGDASFSTASVSAAINTTYDILEITVTGVAATTIDWVAHVDCLEATN